MQTKELNVVLIANQSVFVDAIKALEGTQIGLKPAIYSGSPPENQRRSVEQSLEEKSFGPDIQHFQDQIDAIRAPTFHQPITPVPSLKTK